MVEVVTNVIKPYPNNARKHTPEQVKKIAKSIEQFGFITPIILDEKFMVLAGHGRLLAAKQLGLKKVPVKIVEGLTEEQKRAFSVVDNLRAK